jgi:hypothetical protein
MWRAMRDGLKKFVSPEEWKGVRKHVKALKASHKSLDNNKLLNDALGKQALILARSRPHYVDGLMSSAAGVVGQRARYLAKWLCQPAVSSLNILVLVGFSKDELTAIRPLLLLPWHVICSCNSHALSNGSIKDAVRSHVPNLSASHPAAGSGQLTCGNTNTYFVSLWPMLWNVLPVTGLHRFVVVPGPNCHPSHLAEVDNQMAAQRLILLKEDGDVGTGGGSGGGGRGGSASLQLEVLVLSDDEMYFPQLLPRCSLHMNGCPLDLVNAAVAARRRVPVTALFRTELGAAVGFPLAKLEPARIGLEFLHASCAVTPAYARQPAGFESEQAEQQAAALQDLSASLQKGVPLSWYALEHRCFVDRDIMPDLVRHLSEKRHHVRLRSKTEKSGATSLARSVLYQLRDTFLCVVLQSEATLQPTSPMFKTAYEVLLEVYKAVNRPLLLLCDHDKPPNAFMEALRKGIKAPLLLHVTTLDSNSSGSRTNQPASPTSGGDGGGGGSGNGSGGSAEGPHVDHDEFVLSSSYSKEEKRKFDGLYGKLVDSRHQDTIRFDKVTGDLGDSLRKASDPFGALDFALVPAQVRMDLRNGYDNETLQTCVREMLLLLVWCECPCTSTPHRATCSSHSLVVPRSVRLDIIVVSECAWYAPVLFAVCVGCGWLGGW